MENKCNKITKNAMINVHLGNPFDGNYTSQYKKLFKFLIRLKDSNKKKSTK